MTEFELKFEIPLAKLKGVAVAMLEGKATRQRLQASYFDTADRALAAHGIVVRLRKEGRRWVQTAKGPTADLLDRLEHNAALPSQSAAAMPALDLSRHRETPVGKVSLNENRQATGTVFINEVVDGADGNAVGAGGQGQAALGAGQHLKAPVAARAQPHRPACRAGAGRGFDGDALALAAQQGRAGGVEWAGCSGRA